MAKRVVADLFGEGLRLLAFFWCARHERVLMGASPECRRVAPSTFLHWMRPKENPDGGNLRGEVYGLLAVRPMVEDQKADEKGDCQTSC